MAKQTRVHESDLMDDVRDALADPEPLSLLALVSTLLCVTDTRRDHPLDPPGREARTPPREELARMFIDVRIPETTALLAVIAELADDEVLGARIRRELAKRPGAEPQWLARLGAPTTYRAVRMGHILGDGDDVMLGTRLPSGHELTCVVYVDHNLGSLVKDAFVVPAPLSELLQVSRQAAEDPDTFWEDLSLADARAWIDAGIARAAMTYPPFESESWPACRAIVEWVARTLPAGGTGYQRQEWLSGDQAVLADRFFASRDGAGFDDADGRGLLDAIMWFATEYSTGDPMRWSPVKVEMLFDWMPHKVTAPVEQMAQVPDLLRAFIRFAHHDAGLRPDLTADTLAVLDELDPQYQSAVRAGTPTLADMFEEMWGFGESPREWLARCVGGDAALDRLADQPLPDEEFRWQGIAEDAVERVRELVELTDRCCDALLDVECRTACRRLLSRFASSAPEIVSRGRAENVAAAVVWIIAKVNNLLRHEGGHVLAKDLMSQFGIMRGGASQRAEALLRASGFDTDTHRLCLGSPEYLTAQRRRDIMRSRDQLRQE